MVEIDDKTEEIVYVYTSTRVYEAIKFIASSYTGIALKNVNIQMARIALEALRRGDDEMFKKVKEVNESLDDLLKYMAVKWMDCRPNRNIDDKLVKDWYSYLVINLICIKEHCFLARILHLIYKYLSKIDFIKFSKSDVEKKIDNLSRVIKYLKSSHKILDTLYYIFEEEIINNYKNMLDNIIAKVERGEGINLQEAVRQIMFMYQRSSEKIEKIVEHLLEDPEKEIEELKNIKIPENYRKNKIEIDELSRHKFNLHGYRMIN